MIPSVHSATPHYGFPGPLAEQAPWFFWTRIELIELEPCQEQFAVDATARQGLMNDNLLRARQRMVEMLPQGCA